MNCNPLNLLLFLLFWPLAVQATHITGGEMTYRCLGNNQYEITLTVYRDCYNGQPPFDHPGAIGVFNSDWSLLETMLLPVLTDDTVAMPGTDICINRARYVGSTTLPPAAGPYYLVYQRCCRNQLVRNVANSLSVGLTVLAEVRPEAQALCNASAVFADSLPWQVCNHAPISFTMAASDADGDSLAYRLCMPLEGATEINPMPQPPNPGPYAEVPLENAYSLTNLLGGNDPLAIDALSGALTGIPHEIGQYAVGVCVDEFRDGQLINTVRRDFHLTVRDCMSGLAEANRPVGRLLLQPNPATQEIWMDTPGNPVPARVDVYSAQGVRWSVPRDGARLDISSLPAGLYRIVAVGANQTAVGSFVKR